MLKNYTKVQLPNNYAWQLLDNEIELELSKEVGVNIIQKLAELYALGVEYYQSIHSYKYLYFQRKMTNLMTSPTLQNIKKQQITEASSPNKGQKKEVKQKQEELQKKVLYNAGDVTENKVKDILKHKQKEAEDYNQKVKKSLGEQAENIRAKIMQRKQASQLKLSQSLIQLTRHSSQSSLQPSQPSQQKQKLKIDFTNIINQNQDQEESVYENKKKEKSVPQQQGHKQEEKVVRLRTKTLRSNQFQRTELKKRPKSLSLEMFKQQSD